MIVGDEESFDLDRFILCNVFPPLEPAGANCLKDSCYTFNTIAKTWHDSNTSCKEKPLSELVSIETKEELIFLQERIKKFKVHKEWYIGLSVEVSPWEWISGKPLTIEHWHTQPTGDLKVVILAQKTPPGHFGFFGDTNATIPRGRICETNSKWN